MAELRDFNFEGYLVDPTLPDKELLKRFEHLPEFQEKIGGARMMPHLVRYIILMYDMNSEMKEYWPELGVRKRECALMAGFELTEDQMFDPFVEDILLGRNPYVNDMIVRFVRMFDNPYYLVYVTTFNMLYNEISRSFMDMESKDVKVMNDNLTKLNQQANEYAELMLKGDNLVSLKKGLYKNMEKENLGLRPEEVAAALAKGSYRNNTKPFGY